MTPFSSERWRLLSPYLDQALEISTDDRPAWLASIRARDAGLAADLTTLLEEQTEVQATRFLERGVPLKRQTAPQQSLAGQVLGAYRLVSLIGQGGMGSVWLADRCDGRFEGRAAVKLLNIARMNPAGEERFRREGNILARVTHPNIARLIDAGVSNIGQPYLVLEHIDGVNIDRYCDDRALGIEGRLQLFLDVLEAVAHAHAHLIVHRDIKPANVLVSVDGHVKLLDFGIAKLLEDDERWGTQIEAGALTREGAVALTPHFAAPEQLGRGQVTTATDVYALGVLLYLLLTGEHPAGAALRSTATLIRSIVDEEPRRMSETVGAKSRRALRGDLDTIVAKALKKNVHERYASVMALADDLRRFLRHEPISARPDTLRYRTARFVQRHARGVAASTAMVLLVTLLTAFYTTSLAAERDRAQREAAKAAKVSELMIGVITGVDPIARRATGEGPTVRGLLDAAAERGEKDLSGQPELQSEIFTVFGRVYRRLGVYDRAQRLLEQALASGRTVFGPESVRVAQTLNDLGALLAETGDYERAQECLEESLAMRRKLLGSEHADVAITLVELGRVYQDQGFNHRAEPLHREALAIRTKVLGADHRETAVSLSDLASVLRLNGDLAGAESLIKQSLAINRKTRGAAHPNTGINLHDLGLIAAARGDFASAESLFHQALDIHRTAVGDKHPVLATILNSLSRVLVEQHRYAEAAEALQQALNIARPVLGTNHQLVAIYSINLAAVQLARRDAASAEALLRAALPVRERAPGIVPARRRIFLEDDWSVLATKRLLDAAVAHLQ